jgi:multidrug resistance protein
MKNTPLYIIFLIVFIDLLGFGIIIPILPSYALRDFGSSEITVGLLVASFSLMQLLVTPFWGRVSDRHGRRPILAVTLAISVAGYLLFGLARSIGMLFLARMLSGVGGGNIGAAQAYIADVTPPHERAKGMGLIGAAFGLGFVFGPVAGGLLSRYGYAVPGFTAAGLSLAALLLTVTILPESRRDAGGAAASAFNAAQFGDAFRRPGLGSLLAAFFLATFGYANIYATFPMLATRDFGYTDHEVGYLFGFIGLVGAVTQGLLFRFLSARAGDRLLLRAGSLLTMAGLACIPLHGTTLTLHLVLLVLSLGTGLLTPTALGLISQRADPRRQGAMLGVNQSLGALARTLGPVWGTFTFQSLGHPWPFLSGAIVMLAVLAISWKTV